MDNGFAVFLADVAMIAVVVVLVAAAAPMPGWLISLLH
jgi:hypothetical protein